MDSKPSCKAEAYLADQFAPMSCMNQTCETRSKLVIQLRTHRDGSDIFRYSTKQLMPVFQRRPVCLLEFELPHTRLMREESARAVHWQQAEVQVQMFELLTFSKDVVEGAVCIVVHLQAEDVKRDLDRACMKESLTYLHER